MVNLFAANQQSQTVKQTEDGITRLVDGQDDGTAMTRHPDRERGGGLVLQYPDYNTKTNKRKKDRQDKADTTKPAKA